MLSISLTICVDRDVIDIHFRMGDEEVQSAMDVIEDKRDAARDAFEDLCMTVDKLIEEKAEKQEAARARWEHQSARGSWVT